MRPNPVDIKTVSVLVCSPAALVRGILAISTGNATLDVSVDGCPAETSVFSATEKLACKASLSA